jgi:hypothetical protein
VKQALQASLVLLSWVVAAYADALPSSQQYLWPSLPVGLQKELKKAGGEGRPDTIYDVVRFSDGTLTLWLISGPQSRCQAPPPELAEFQGPECPVGLYLEEQRSFKPVGQAHGALTIATPESGDLSKSVLPTELRFSAPRKDGARKQEQLLWKDGHYELQLVPATLVDPLTYERLSPEDLENRAREDLDRGHYPAAAGRLSTLCALGCNAELFEFLGLAALKSAAPARAEAALREAVTLEPYRASAWLLLGDAMVNVGKRDQARQAYAHAQKDPALGPFVKQRLDILDGKVKPK